MRRFTSALAISLLLPLSLPASEFDWLVREFSRESGVRQTHIPFFGVARFVVAVVRPAGTSDLKLAVFEHANMPSDRFREVSDAVVGDAWKPIVRVRSRNRESTNIYTQRDGDHLKLLIATIDHDTATFVEVRIKPEALLKFVDEHRHTN